MNFSDSFFYLFNFIRPNFSHLLHLSWQRKWGRTSPWWKVTWIRVWPTVCSLFTRTFRTSTKTRLSYRAGQQPHTKFDLDINVTRNHFSQWMIKALCACCDFRGILELTNFQEGFREALPYWLNQVFTTTQERVERAVQVDQVCFWGFFWPWVSFAVFMKS